MKKIMFFLALIMSTLLSAAQNVTSSIDLNMEIIKNNNKELTLFLFSLLLIIIFIKKNKRKKFFSILDFFLIILTILLIISFGFLTNEELKSVNPYLFIVFIFFLVIENYKEKILAFFSKKFPKLSKKLFSEKKKGFV